MIKLAEEKIGRTQSGLQQKVVGPNFRSYGKSNEIFYNYKLQLVEI